MVVAGAAVCALSYSRGGRGAALMSSSPCTRQGCASASCIQNPRGARVAAVVHAARIRRPGDHAALRRVCSSDRGRWASASPATVQCSRSGALAVGLNGLNGSQRRKKRPFIHAARHRPATERGQRRLSAQAMAARQDSTRRFLTHPHLQRRPGARNGLSRLDELHRSLGHGISLQAVSEATQAGLPTLRQDV